jgi:hypothetical protein
MDLQALIILAEMLDKARMQANSIADTESEQGVYGEVKRALTSTLEIICYNSGHHPTLGYRVYESMSMNGDTVRQALEAEGIV